MAYLGSLRRKIERNFAPGANLFCQLKGLKFGSVDPACGPIAFRFAEREVNEIDVLVIGCDIRQLNGKGSRQLPGLVSTIDGIERRRNQNSANASLFGNLAHCGIIR